MNDGLEQFIKENRGTFDHLKAPVGVWDRVAPLRRVEVSVWKYTAIAASALLLVAVGYIFGMKSQSGPRIAGMEEYEEAERYYQSRIDQKMETIKTLPVSQEVLNDLQVLDEVYVQLRKQLEEDPNADAQLLLSAMIRHQQQKLDMMEKIVNRVDKYQNHDQENRAL